MIDRSILGRWGKLLKEDIKKVFRLANEME